MRLRGCRGRYHGGPGSDIYGLLEMVLIGIVALPFVEDRLLITGKSEENKILGGVLLIVGIVIWIACGSN